MMRECVCWVKKFGRFDEYVFYYSVEQFKMDREDEILAASSAIVAMHAANFLSKKKINKRKKRRWSVNKFNLSRDR